MKRLTLFLILVLALPIGVKAFDVSGRDKATVVGLLVGANSFKTMDLQPNKKLNK